MANQELIFSCRCFGHSPAKSPIFFSSTPYHSIAFHMQQFALRKHISRCFAIEWVLYRGAWNASSLLALLVQLIFFLLSSENESPTSKGCPSCGSPSGVLFKRGPHRCSPARLARFGLLLDGPSPAQLPHPLNSTAMCCWRTGLPFLSPCAILRHPLGWFININMVVLARVHEASSPHIQTPSLL